MDDCVIDWLTDWLTDWVSDSLTHSLVAALRKHKLNDLNSISRSTLERENVKMYDYNRNSELIIDKLTHSLTHSQEHHSEY